MRRLAHHGGDKGITPAGVVDDVALACTAVAHRLAQRGEMRPQSALIDDRVGPGASDQTIFVDRLAGTFNERDQNIQCAAAEAQRVSVVEQQSLRGDQPERSKDEGFPIHRGSVGTCRDRDSRQRHNSRQGCNSSSVQCENSDWAGQVFEALLPHVIERVGQLVADLVTDHPRDADATRLC